MARDIRGSVNMLAEVKKVVNEVRKCMNTTSDVRGFGLLSHRHKKLALYAIY